MMTMTRRGSNWPVGQERNERAMSGLLSVGEILLNQRPEATATRLCFNRRSRPQIPFRSQRSGRASVAERRGNQRTTRITSIHAVQFPAWTGWAEYLSAAL